MEQGANANNDKMELFKSQVESCFVQSSSWIMCRVSVQAKQLLKKMNPRSTAKMSIESNPYIFQ